MASAEKKAAALFALVPSAVDVLHFEEVNTEGGSRRNLLKREEAERWWFDWKRVRSLQTERLEQWMSAVVVVDAADVVW